MTTNVFRPLEATLPLVAVVCSVPMVFEALQEALAPIAEVRSFPANGETAGLLRWLQPDAVIVDREEEAEDAARVARELDLPLVHVSLADRRVRVLKDGVWLDAATGDGPTPETVRNVIAGGLYGRRKQ